jgi:glycosyl transferase family 25
MLVPAFVINLDRSPDRLAFMRQQAERFGLPFERVSAVDGHNVPPEYARHFAHYQNGTEPLLAPGAIGCYASHLKVWRAILAAGHPAALVLEDDAEFDADVVRTIEVTLATLPARWEMAHLSQAPKHAYKALAHLPGGRELVRYSRVPYGTAGYLISASGAAKMLAANIGREWAVDTDTRRTWLFGLDAYGVVPPPMRQRGVASTIRAMGGQHRLRAGIPPPSRWLLLRSPQSASYNIRKLGFGWWLRCLALNCAFKVRAAMRPVGQALRPRSSRGHRASVPAR